MLYILATPIGNLSDITLRALEILKTADFIIAENPGHTKKLLDHYGIKTPSPYPPPEGEGKGEKRWPQSLGDKLIRGWMIQFAEHNEQRVLPSIIERLKNQNAALVSDAGTPGISDPGFRLVRGCIENKIDVIPIPGPSAAITALCASGLPTDSFTFLGFVPKTEIRLIKELTKALEASSTAVCYESPQRIQKTLGYIAKAFPTAHIVLARELTKLHEEFLRGTVMEVLNAINEKHAIKGELVVLVSLK